MARDVGERVELLWTGGDATGGGEVRGGRLPPQLAARHDGDLIIRLAPGRPTLVSNFVTTLDGVVALTADGTTGGGDVSGFSEPDRFMMGLLRALADAVLVAAGTFNADGRHEWTPRRVHPATAEATAAWRAELGLAPQPTTIIVTGSGRIDPAHRALAAQDVPSIVVTSETGAEELRRRGLPDRVSMRPVSSGGRVAPGNVVQVAADAGFRLVVCEGGPQLFGELLAARLVDEAFHTLAPHLAGRGPGVERRSLVEGVSLGDRDGLWGRLLTVHRAASHLFLRYDLRS